MRPGKTCAHGLLHWIAPPHRCATRRRCPGSDPKLHEQSKNCMPQERAREMRHYSPAAMRALPAALMPCNMCRYNI
jgi:hypothetical protein